jgi:hypothetical protein
MTRRSPAMQKHMFIVMCPGSLFMETALSPPMHEKECVDISRPGRTGMHHLTRRSHRMQKHKLCKMYSFSETAKGPQSHKKWYVDISYSECTGMHYVTRRCHQIKKHKLGSTCPDALFVKSVPVPAEHEKECDHISHLGGIGMIT